MSVEIQLPAGDEWSPDTRLVDLLLEEQQTLSAVDEFSQAHAQLPHDRSHYETLIPSRLPEAKEQFAFRVDLDACTGCKACVTACHSLNGLEEDETWRTVGLVETVPDEAVACVAHQQTVTSACHHCEDPACLAGCPVQAYEKDEISGIVRHLDDQCIGCRYCQLTCPYDVPTYSERLGIVRKCDMCHDRLKAGEAPACVQGCPNQAISIAIVPTGRDNRDNRDNAVESDAPNALLQVVQGAMPSSDLTHPTTQYISRSAVGAPLFPAQLANVEPSEGHRPLAVMLVLTQMSVGILAISSVASVLNPLVPASVLGDSLSSAATLPAFTHAIALTLASLIGFAGLGASILHLGRPQWAFRAFLGLRTSWMSREIIVLGGYAGLMSAACGLAWLDWGILSQSVGSPFSQLSGTTVSKLASVTAGVGAAVGLLGIFCSIQIYAVTGRPLWRFDRTTLRFGGTTLLLGSAGFGFASLLALLASGSPIESDFSRSLLLCTAFAGVATLSAIKLKAETGVLVHAAPDESDDGARNRHEGIALERTRSLLDSSLKSVQQRRRLLAAAAGIAFAILCAGLIAIKAPIALSLGVALLVLIGSMGGELFERSLFFSSEAAPAMPRVH